MLRDHLPASLLFDEEPREASRGTGGLIVINESGVADSDQDRRIAEDMQVGHFMQQRHRIQLA